MPTWGEILTEITETAQLLHAQGAQNVNPFDVVRRKYLDRVATHTHRPTVLYATAWLSNPNAPAQFVSMSEDDMLGFMETIHGLPGPNLDLILHSPGGSGSAAEQIVKYLRTKFDDIRIVVPHMAMSAATMIACAADQIVMGKHSFLGPIDPQLLMQTALGPRSVPAQAILEQFDRALQDAADPVKLRVWAPMLTQYGPDLLVTCQNAVRLSEDLVSEWLKLYMFRGQADAEAKGKAIAHWLSDHNAFKTHARPISRDELIAKGLSGIYALEQNQIEQDLFLSVHHATAHTFSSTAAVKIIENNLGKTYVRSVEIMQAVMPAPPQPPLPPPPARLPVPPKAPERHKPVAK
jgi:Serine dehydrogenase proteinase